MNIRDNLDNHKAMTAMAKALDISEDNLQTDEDGGFEIIGKPDKPLKAIQYHDDTYWYFIKAESTRKASAIRKKLISFGWQPYMQKNGNAHLFMRRLPEGDEPTYLRNLSGFRQMRSLQAKKQTLPLVN